MASATEIANLALTKLGDEGEIIELTEDTRAARAVNSCFAAMRNAVLRDHPWNFATKRTQLAASTDVPAWGGYTAFPLPSDFLRLLEIEHDPEWQLEGQFILVRQAGPLNLRYTARIEDTGLFDALFVEALACRIAVQVATRITGNASAQDMAEGLYRAALAAAKRVDGQDNPPDELPDYSWFASRELDG